MYKHEYMSNFDLLVALQLLSQQRQNCCEGSWDFLESVCQISPVFLLPSILWAAIDSHGRIIIMIIIIIIIGKCPLLDPQF